MEKNYKNGIIQCSDCGDCHHFNGITQCPECFNMIPITPFHKLPKDMLVKIIFTISEMYDKQIEDLNNQISALYTIGTDGLYDCMEKGCSGYYVKMGCSYCLKCKKAFCEEHMD